MIVVVLENPDPSDPKRNGVDLEFRVMIKGVAHDEEDLITSLFGEAIHNVAKLARPKQQLKAFQIDDFRVLG